MNYSKIKTIDISNGPGVRTSLFVSGCRRHCPGCFNESTWPFDAGQKFTSDTTEYILSTLDNRFVDGLSILGGEPLEDENMSAIYDLTVKTKHKFPNKTIWLWSGYTYDELITKPRFNDSIGLIFRNIDVLVDGPFDIYKKDLALKYRGSSNQRIIDIPKTLQTKAIVLWEDIELFATHGWPNRKD